MEPGIQQSDNKNLDVQTQAPPELPPAQSQSAPEVPGLQPNIWGGWPTAGFGAVILVGYFIVQLFVAFVFIFLNVNSSGKVDITDITNLASNGLLISVATYFSAAAGLVLTVVFIKIRRNASITEYLGLKSLKVKSVFAVLGITLIVMFLLELLVTVFSQPGNASDQYTLNAYKTVWPPLIWIAVVIFAPAFEEALFRGFLFVGFRTSRLGTAGTIIFTALLWAGLHSLQYNALGVATIFIFGIVLGVIRLLTRSLWSTIIAHSFWNLLTMVLLVLVLNGIIK